MKLSPIDDTSFELVAGWLGRPEIYQWLDFGYGTQCLPPQALKAMLRRDIHVLRTYTGDDDSRPIGVVALSNVSHTFKTATLWVVLGERRYGGRGYPARAVSRLLTLGFRELDLGAINAWAVECNHASIRIMKRLGFQYIGRQRRCHRIAGECYDRLLFDLLPSEHREFA